MFIPFVLLLFLLYRFAPHNTEKAWENKVSLEANMRNITQSMDYRLSINGQNLVKFDQNRVHLFKCTVVPNWTNFRKTGDGQAENINPLIYNTFFCNWDLERSELSQCHSSTTILSSSQTRVKVRFVLCQLNVVFFQETSTAVLFFFPLYTVSFSFKVMWNQRASVQPMG